MHLNKLSNISMNNCAGRGCTWRHLSQAILHSLPAPLGSWASNLMWFMATLATNVQCFPSSFLDLRWASACDCPNSSKKQTKCWFCFWASGGSLLSTHRDCFRVWWDSFVKHSKWTLLEMDIWVLAHWLLEHVQVDPIYSVQFSNHTGDANAYFT